MDIGPDEVLVQTAACGLCHSDLHVMEGKMVMPPPVLLGHEAAGVVQAVGSDVTEFSPVIMSSVVSTCTATSAASARPGAGTCASGGGC